MKRYLVFAGDTYYPGVGWNDFVGDFDTLEEAYAKAKEEAPTDSYRWAHIVDTTTKEIVG